MKKIVDWIKKKIEPPRSPEVERLYRENEAIRALLDSGTNPEEAHKRASASLKEARSTKDHPLIKMCAATFYNALDAWNLTKKQNLLAARSVRNEPAPQQEDSGQEETETAPPEKAEEKRPPQLKEESVLTEATEEAILQEFDRIEALLKSNPQAAYTRAKATFDRAQELGNQRKSTDWFGRAAHKALPFPDSFKEAVKYQKEAAEMAQEIGDEEYYAWRQKRLGKLYADIPTAASLRQAIHYYRRAIKIFRQHENQKGVASVRWSMGNAYRRLPTGSKTANLRRAIACYHSSLKFHTERDSPEDYADLHHNLGITYTEQDTRTAPYKTESCFRTVYNGGGQHPETE